MLLRTRFSSRDQRDVPYIGLEKILLDMDMLFQAVHIPEGKSTEEMWELFEVIYSQLQEGDELYLDITNSFRYLPMLLVVLVNYAKMLKNVTVKAIFYGNYDARDKVSNVAPIMDFLPLSVLQDWTSATSDYLRYGQVEKLYDLSESSINPILKNPSTRTDDVKLLRAFVNRLKDLVGERITCRGLSIIENKNVGLLEKAAKDIQEVTIPQLKPVFEKIKESLDIFGAKEDILNCIKAARWCCDNKMYQQTTTLLEEGLITFLCCHFKLDYKEENFRNLMGQCLRAKTRPNEKTVFNDPALVEKLLDDSVIWENKQFVTSFQCIKDMRNDYNHAGFNKDPKGVENIIDNVESLMDDIESILSKI
jgi:CRISPR-associated DxTHG motif protein